MQAMQQLLEIMGQLRDPEKGCPWDLRQTYSTIVPYTLEEAYEVADTIQRGEMAELRDELGDLLFSMVNLIRLFGMDAEQSLSHANAKFERRFRAMERALLDTGNTDLQELSLEQMDAAWERVKQAE